MKVLHCTYSKNKFADKYTLDLEGFMSPREFTTTINTFNTAAWRYPPPVSIGSSISHTVFVCLIIVIFISLMTIIRQTNQMELIWIPPFSLLAIIIIIIYYRHRQRFKFESAITHLCSCMNAIENVRGINFRLTLLTTEQKCLTPQSISYAITIEFDERYNLLHHFFNTITSSSILPSYSTSISISSPETITDDILTKPSSAYNPNEKYSWIN
ncbi:uncharacterized protein BX663DRAFT_543587 [Cokeromyces recurvatus]|uniref:uncharacterized protein n=1 Tax=Cokeromyces recurvatus TaxID=90255 RepID=UPI00221E3B66|nr:uncharacterized protein BX663DRAFT_543587 [Cokeromyces recurvatus]KAI7902116.1 hypothetical protein BX663DRAFT_543587 [Cokeromyces recurvatus]